MEHFETFDVPADRRLSDLTFSMLGKSRPGPEIGPRHGCPMSCKAAETGVLMDFAVATLSRHRRRMPASSYPEELLCAGRAMQSYLGVIRTAGSIVSSGEQEDLVHFMRAHLVNARLADIHFVPKHHLWVHLTLRTNKTSCLPL